MPTLTCGRFGYFITCRTIKNESPFTYCSFRYKTAIVRFMGVRFLFPTANKFS